MPFRVSNSAHGGSGTVVPGVLIQASLDCSHSLLCICSLHSLPVPQMTLFRVTGTALMEQFPNLKGLSVLQ